MSSRSGRRAAEMAVINAAFKYLDTGYRIPLEAACDAYEALALTQPTRAATSNNSTDTSAQAGASMFGIVGPLARKCFDEITVVCTAGGRGLTCDQIEMLVGGTHQTISARVNELRDHGWITDSGTRRPTRSGRQAIVWEPTEMAKRQSI